MQRIVKSCKTGGQNRRAASACGTIEALTRALAVELAPIRVDAVSPGVVRTSLWQNMTAPERERLYESVGSSLPVGRVGEASEIAQAYLFLMQGRILYWAAEFVSKFMHVRVI
jgi:NAD(P)-dependent dehydrogenase (short-subunit alcohol dehydrogenase family)